MITAFLEYATLFLVFLQQTERNLQRLFFTTNFLCGKIKNTSYQHLDFKILRSCCSHFTST